MYMAKQVLVPVKSCYHPNSITDDSSGAMHLLQFLFTEIIAICLYSEISIQRPVLLNFPRESVVFHDFALYI